MKHIYKLILGVFCAFFVTSYMHASQNPANSVNLNLNINNNGHVAPVAGKDSAFMKLVKTAMNESAEYFRSIAKTVSDPRSLAKRVLFVFIIIGIVTCADPSALQAIWQLPFYLKSICFLGNNYGSIFLMGLKALSSLGSFFFKYSGLKFLLRVSSAYKYANIINWFLSFIGSSYIAPYILDSVEHLSNAIFDKLFPVKPLVIPV